MTSNRKTSRICICHTYTSWGGRHNAITKSVSQLCKKESGCSGKHTNSQRWQQFVERRFNEGLLFKFSCLPYDNELTRISKGLFDTFRTMLFPKFFTFLQETDQGVITCTNQHVSCILGQWSDRGKYKFSSLSKKIACFLPPFNVGGSPWGPLSVWCMGEIMTGKAIMNTH